jgi:hypothetical protein
MVNSPIHSPYKRKRSPFSKFRVILSIVLCAGVLLNLRYNRTSPELQSGLVQLPTRSDFEAFESDFKILRLKSSALSQTPQDVVIPSPSPVVVTVNTTTLTAFVDSGGRFPILLLTRKRVPELNATISSLLSVRGVNREAIFVIQDGNETGIVDVVKSYGLRYHQKVDRPAIPSNIRTVLNIRGFRIASHFRYSLDFMFENVTDVRLSCGLGSESVC